jgi:hypothetical protein
MTFSITIKNETLRINYSVDILSVVMLNVANKPFMLNVVMLNAVMLSDVAPKRPFCRLILLNTLFFRNGPRTVRGLACSLNLI